MAPGGQGGARPLGDSSLQVPSNRLPPAAPTPQASQTPPGTPPAHQNAPGSPPNPHHAPSTTATRMIAPGAPGYQPATPIDIPAPRAFGPRTGVRFAGEDLDAHDGAAVQLRARSDSMSNGSARSISPPPDYRDGSVANSEAGSPLNPYGSNSPPPNYHGVRLHDGEALLGHDGVPFRHPDDSPGSSGMNTPSPLELGTPVGGRSPAHAFSGSPASMSSEQLEAYLNSLPPLSRFPTPPARD